MCVFTMGDTMTIRTLAHLRGNVVSFLLACVSPLILPGCLYPGGMMPAPERDDTQGTWIATEGNWAFFRLCLDNDGAGLFGATFHSEPTMVYRVTSWQLADTAHAEQGEPEQLKRLAITLTPVGNARPLELSGWAGKTHLRLRLAWEGWRPRSATFCNEGVVMGRAQQTREVMQAPIPK